MNKNFHWLTYAVVALAAILSAAFMQTATPLIVGSVMLMATGARTGFGMCDTNPAEALDGLMKELATKMSEFKTVTQEIRDSKAELATKQATNDTALKSVQDSVDGFLTKFNGLQSELKDVEQRLSQAHETEQKGMKSWGEQFVASDRFTETKDRSSRRGTISAEVKQVTSAAAGGLIRSARETEIVGIPQRRLTMRNLLRTIPIATSSVDYAVQTNVTNNAAPVGEGLAKPYSDYVWGSATAVVRTIAHLTKITRQALDDAPRLVGEIDQEMRYGLGLVEEAQFLYGSGTGNNLYGIIPQATAFVKNAGFGTDANATRIDVLRLAMVQSALSLFPADGIVMNEVDWAFVEMAKDANGGYIFAQPQNIVSPRMWGLNVVATPAMTVGDFLVGNFGVGATIYDRMGVEVLISTENVDDFEKNLATMRAEERIALAVKRPGAFVYGGFTAAVASLKV